eukprot:GHVU01217480.1.p4 GENE.GHVU01217480.1~~GHVU01217480.1.p4  ORF type:complete len:126 (-),score=10.54 GHVU01217480.1:154-531(-)
MGYSDEGSPVSVTWTIYMAPSATVSRAPDEDMEAKSSGTEELSQALHRMRLRSASLESSEPEVQAGATTRRAVVLPDGNFLPGALPGTPILWRQRKQRQRTKDSIPLERSGALTPERWLMAPPLT